MGPKAQTATQNASVREKAAGMLERAYLEITPAPGIVERLVDLPRHAFLSITCSPRHGIDPTLDMVDELCALPDERRLQLVPHVAARVVRDRGHLREILARLDAAGVAAVFVPGGDAAQPWGDYDCSLDLLRDMAEIGHSIPDVGIAAHPEGHPLVEDAELLRLLREKQRYASYLVTQMCFDPATLIGWLRGIRAAGVGLPAWLGLPGVVEIPKLLSLSVRIGVGRSLRILRRQKGMLERVMSARPYRPDDLLDGLLRHLDDPELDIPGFHLFCFNNVGKTERWRTESALRMARTEDGVCA